MFFFIFLFPIIHFSKGKSEESCVLCLYSKVTFLYILIIALKVSYITVLDCVKNGVILADAATVCIIFQGGF